MGGAGSAVMRGLQAAGVLKPVLQLGLPDEFIEHGDPAKLLALQGLDAAGIRSLDREALSGPARAGAPGAQSRGLNVAAGVSRAVHCSAVISRQLAIRKIVHRLSRENPRETGSHVPTIAS